MTEKKSVQQKTVLGIGIATVDYLLTVPRYPSKDTKSHCSSFITEGGGNCANTMVALSRLGVKTFILTCVGNDNVGMQIKTSLQKEDVVTDYIIEKGKQSPLSIIIVGKDDTSRTIIHRSGGDYTKALPCRDTILEGIDLLYCDGRFSATAEKLAHAARKKGIRMVVEAERTGLDVEKLFCFADILITSKNYHMQAFGTEHFKENMKMLTTKGPRLVITTLGAQGCLCMTGKELLKKPSVKTKVVDTTGAGDAFIAGIIYGILHGWKIEKSLHFASQVAAFKCRKPGARAGLPYKGEIGGI
jgi:sugar/nucleoside kinase (ribokinase family)